MRHFLSVQPLLQKSKSQKKKSCMPSLFFLRSAGSNTSRLDSLVLKESECDYFAKTATLVLGESRAHRMQDDFRLRESFCQWCTAVLRPLRRLQKMRRHQKWIMWCHGLVLRFETWQDLQDLETAAQFWRWYFFQASLVWRFARTTMIEQWVRLWTHF